MIDIVKKCKIHGELNIEQIYKTTPRGKLYFRCKECNKANFKKHRKKYRESQKIYYKKYRETHIEKFKMYYANNKEERNKKNKEWRLKNKAYLIRKESGIEIKDGEYEKLLKDQNNLCKICNLPEKILSRNRDRVKYLSLDHCHKTKKIRGLLCHSCNTALGHFRDSIELLQSAINYIKISME